MRSSTRILLGFLIGSFLVANLAYSDETIEYRKEGKSSTIVGSIVEESVGGIKLKVGSKEQSLDVRDLIRVNYELTGTVKQEWAEIKSLEDKGEFAKAIEKYKGLQDRLAKSTISDKTKRDFDYRLVRLKAILGTEDAIDSLNKFLQANPNSWQAYFVTKQLAQLQVSKGDYDGAAKSIQNLQKTPNFPAALKSDMDLQLVDILFQGKRYADVMKNIQEAIPKLAANDPQRERLTIYQIGCQSEADKIEETEKKLKEIIDKSSNESIKALAYNTLGECNLAKNRKREAMWNFLQVEVVYPKDTAERVKALDRLVKIFESDPFKDEARAKTFKERLSKVR